MNNDLEDARRIERQILKEKYPLGCGCVLESKYGHPRLRRGWILVNSYTETCSIHQKVRASFEQEKKQKWHEGSFMPRWRDAYGLWVLRKEWEDSLIREEFEEGTPEGVFEYKGKELLLLVGCLGSPVVLGADKGEKMEGRIICLELATGKTFPAPVPDDVLRHFGWVKMGG